MAEPLTDREYFERLFAEHHKEHEELAAATAERALIVQRELERRDVSVKELAAGIQRDSDRRDVSSAREIDRRDVQTNELAAGLQRDREKSEQLAKDQAAGLRAERDKSDATVKELAQIHAFAHDREHQMTDQALHKAELSMDKRMEGLNELRGVLADQSAFMVRRDFLDASLKSLDAKVETLASSNAHRISQIENNLAQMAGRDHGLGISWSILASVIVLTGVIVGVVAHFWR